MRFDIQRVFRTKRGVINTGIYFNPKTAKPNIKIDLPNGSTIVIAAPLKEGIVEWYKDLDLPDLLDIIERMKREPVVIEGNWLATKGYLM